MSKKLDYGIRIFSTEALNSELSFYVNFITKGLSGVMRTVQHITLVLIIKIFTVKARRTKFVNNYVKNRSASLIMNITFLQIVLPRTSEHKELTVVNQQEPTGLQCCPCIKGN
jgi:hypothetical protein